MVCVYCIIYRNVHSQPVVLNVNDFPGKIMILYLILQGILILNHLQISKCFFKLQFADTIKTLDAVLIVTDNNYNNEDSRNEMTILIEGILYFIRLILQS